VWRPTSVDRPTGVFIGLIIVSLVLITVDLRASGAGIGGTLREGVQDVFTPVQRVVAAGTRPVAEFLEDLSDILSLRGENRRLRDEVIELERQLAEGESLLTRVGELEAILGLEPPAELDSIVAQVLAVGVSEFDHSRVIDRGRSAGITVDMPVIDEGGLVGRVISVTDQVSRVQLITDPSVRVAVRQRRRSVPSRNHGCACVRAGPIRSRLLASHHGRAHCTADPYRYRSSARLYSRRGRDPGS